MAAGVVVDTASLLVILVDFSDHTWDGSTHNQTIDALPYQFDSILFSDSSVDVTSNPTGSMTDFYVQNSYGNFYIIGQVTNWLRMPSTYAYYVFDTQTAGLPPLGRADILARDAVLAADVAGENFQNFDHDDDGVLDGLVIIHAGRGAETGGYGIWSHKFHLPSQLNIDGVEVFDYTMNPEEFPGAISPIGVICHEYGHTFGLPDLYDIDYSPPGSEGLGVWSLMAAGTYNLNGMRPAHFDAWCKSQIGFLNLINVTNNLDSVALPAVEFSPVAYRLNNAQSSPEYWIVENRQKMGFDLNLPGGGILIYHVDPAVGGSNNNPDRYHVALEQADGNFDLEYTLNNAGDAGDPYPGSSGNREFHDYTTPSDVANYSPFVYPHIGVLDISNSDSIMYADLEISHSRPLIELISIDFDDALGNNDGNLDGGENIRVYITTRNIMRTGYNVRVQLATSNSYVNFTSNNVEIADSLNGIIINNNSNPITFTLADSTPPSLDSFYLTIYGDSTLGGAVGNDEAWSPTFGLERTVGTPDYLIVDDDRGDAHDVMVTGVFTTARVPANVWHINTQGVPSLVQLEKYPSVFWFTGDSAANVIDTSRINRMRGYLDAGNNLFLSSMSGIRDIHLLDSAFLANYFKARYFKSTDLNDARGVVGSTLGNGTRYRPAPAIPFDDQRQHMVPVNGGESFLTWTSGVPDSSCGISYGNGYKTVLISFAFEAIQSPGGNFRPPDTLLARVLSFFNDFSTGIGDEPFGNLPESFELFQNYPNPFNPSTTIAYTIHSRGSSKSPDRTKLEIYNLLGQRVRTLVDELQSPGSYSLEWNGENDSGRKMSSGIYFYRLILGDESVTKKMMLVK
jgi:M6 family metalloprotease-like protein